MQQPAYIAPRVGELNVKAPIFLIMLFKTHQISDTNANQFVNQGYNNISFTQATPQSPSVYSPPGTRVIPIQVEGRSPSSMERTVIMTRYVFKI